MVIAQEVGEEQYFHFNTKCLPKAFNGVRVPAAVDTNAFYEVPKADDMTCDLAITCEYDAKLMSIMFPIGKHNVRIYGPKWLNTMQYLGNISVDELRTLYVSAKVCYAKTAKEAVRIAACGGLAISMEWNVESALGECFYVERLETVLDQDNTQLFERWQQQQKIVLPDLTYESVFKQLQEKGLEL